MSARHGRSAWIALALALAASCGGEMVEEKVDVGFQGEAQRNPLLAAQTFARESGREVETTVTFELPSADDGVVIVSAAELGVRTELHTDVDAWLASGGCLVITAFGLERPAPFDWNVQQSVPWYARFDVRSNAVPDMEIASDDEALEAVDAELARFADEWGTSTRTSRGRLAFVRLLVECEDTATLRQRAELGGSEEPLRGVVGERNEADALLFRAGAGHVLFLANGSPFWNGALAQADNAEFFARVLALGGERRVVFVHGRDETLWTLLMERAPWFVWCAIALVILALWRFAGRFGPPIVEPAAARHAFADHVVASGRFVWRRAGAPALVAPLRRRVVRLAARASAVDSTDGAAIAAALERTSGAPLDRITSDLEGAVPRDPARFTALVERLHELESVHDRHARTDH